MVSESRMRPLLVLSDLHLTRSPDPQVCAQVAALLAAHPDHELILNGDTFHWSVEPAGYCPGMLVAETLERAPALADALRHRLAHGTPVTILAGNHDVLAAAPHTLATACRALGVSEQAPLRGAAWFLHRGRLHIEHGHLYDADNAPAHPLVPPAGPTEPLGVAITRRFLTRHGALEFVHASETTPARGLARACRRYRARAPRVVLGYFAYAAHQCWLARHAALHRSERDEGNRRLDHYAQEHDLDLSHLYTLSASLPRPTHHSVRATFSRLYLDRASATFGTLAGTAIALSGASLAGLGVTAACSTYLLASIARKHNRYAGRVEAALEMAARRIRELAGIEWVVMGHSHHACSTPGYLNSGSFTHAKGGGRPFLHVDETGHPELRHWTQALASC